MVITKSDFMASIDERLDEKLVWAIASALLVVHVVLVWRSREIGLITAQDDGRYILLARSLLDFSYRDIYLVGLPYHASYPPVFPAALAIWSLVFGESFGGFLIMNAGFTVLALGIAFLAIRRAWSASGALLCLACMAVNPFLVQRPGGVRSETLYIGLAYLALWALASRKPSHRMMWMAAAAAIVAALTRSVGLALVAAIGIVWLAEKRYRPLAGFSAAVAVTVGAWMAWSALAPDQVVGYHYFADVLNQDGALGLLSALGQRVAELAPNYAGLTTPWVLAVPTIPGTPVDNVFISALTLLAVVVGVVHLSRRWPVAIVYMLLYAVLLVVWPYHRPRFMEPLIPLLLAAALIGVGVVVGRFKEGWAVPAVVLTAVLLIFGGAVRTISLMQLRQSCDDLSLAEPPSCLPIDRASFLRAVDYIDRRTDKDAVFVTAKPEALFYYTSRRSVLLQATFLYEGDRYVDDLRRQGVDYVILGSVHADELLKLAPRLATQCEDLEFVEFFPPRTYLFRVDGEGDTSRLDPCEALEEHRKSNLGRRFTGDRS